MKKTEQKLSSLSVSFGVPCPSPPLECMSEDFLGLEGDILKIREVQPLILQIRELNPKGLRDPPKVAP